jgi:hypothetical protein
MIGTKPLPRNPDPKRLPVRKRVTIAAGILCPDRIVLCTDSQETIGHFKRCRPKLTDLPLATRDVTAVTVGSTDDAVFLDGLVEKISDAIDHTDGYLASVRTAIEKAVRKHCGAIWALYPSVDYRPTADLLIGLKTIDDLALIQVSTPNVSSVHGYEFIGSGSDLAGYKSKQFCPDKIPVEAAACLAAYMLEVVYDNNIHSSGPTQMAIIWLDGTVDHKSADFCHRVGSALMKWDYYANRVGSMIPFLSGRDGTSIIDQLVALDKGGTPPQFLNDEQLEMLLSGLIANQATKPLPSGAVNLFDANVFRTLRTTQAFIDSVRDSIQTGTLQPSETSKALLNETITVFNNASAEYQVWHDAAAAASAEDKPLPDSNKLGVMLQEVQVDTCLFLAHKLKQLFFQFQLGSG